MGNCRKSFFFFFGSYFQSAEVNITTMEPSGIMFSNVTDFVLCDVCGILLSLYALYVELRKEKNPDYVAACDINAKMNCSKVLTSE